MKRSDFIEKMSVELATKVGEAQTELLKAILTYVDGAFDIKNGKIISGKTNYGKAYLIDKAYDFFIKNNQQPLVKWFAEKVFDLFGLNRDYYKKFADDEKKYLSISDNVLSEQLARLGVTDKKEFLKGGFLDDLATNKNPLQGIKQKAIAAIAQGKSLSDFKAEMSEFVKGSEGKLGVLERHFNTAAYDEFARFDRATGKAYADNLKLDFVVYEGTTMLTTRLFCRSKVGKVFDRTQIQAWAKLSFDGKPATGYNPFIDLGGYHCRHTLNWIDEATARYIDPARFNKVKTAKEAKAALLETDFSKAEKESISGWSGTDYIGIGRFERGKINKESSDYEIMKKRNIQLNKTLDKVPQFEGTVYRGERDLSIASYNRLKNLSKDSEFSFDQKVSSSLELAAANNYSASNNFSVVYQIEGKTSRYIADLALIPADKEAIIMGDTRFEIVNIEETNVKNSNGKNIVGKLIIKLKEK